MFGAAEFSQAGLLIPTGHDMRRNWRERRDSADGRLHANVGARGVDPGARVTMRRTPPMLRMLPLLGAIVAACERASTEATVEPSAAAPSVVRVSMGEHACAVTTTGSAHCWGYNGSGQLGTGARSQYADMPTAVAGRLVFRSVAVPILAEYTCGLVSTGDAYCWGANSDAQLGNGTATSRLSPTKVLVGVRFTSASAGRRHACALTATGTAYCWGSTSTGALGTGVLEETSTTPAVAASGLTFQSIGAGSSFTCGLTPAGAAYCWGAGRRGELGGGDTVDSPVPVPVAGGITFRSLAVGSSHACALTGDGAAYCWGRNSFGAVGDGSTTLRSAPVAVRGGLAFASIAAGFESTCGVTTSGAGYCWGFNVVGQVGDGTLTDRTAPTAISGELRFRSLSPGLGATCGVTTSDALYCWGANSDGALGDGTIVDRPTPAPVRWP